MALMLLADRWARARGGRAWGLTVDHGLRPESADEARTVGSWLGARAIPHEILRWAGPKPVSGIQEAAREARYRLLAAWCRRHFCLHLLAAHHLEDQIETHLIRRRAGSGIDGLAGMSAVRELRGCRLVRPLLAVPRERLAALLAAEGQPFLRDPSNLDPVFERARLRLALSGKPSSPLSGEGVGVRGRVSGRLPASLRRSLLPRQAPLSRGARVDLPARTDLAVRPPRGARLRPRADRARARGRCADRPRPRTPPGRVRRARSGNARRRRPRDRDARAVASRLVSRRVALSGQDGAACPAACGGDAGAAAGHTLGGCRFVPWRGRVLVLRELVRAAAPIALEPGADLCWDRRFAVSLSSRATAAVTIGYLGQYAGAAPEGGFGRKTAASGPFRAARLLGRRGHYGGASSPLCPARSAGSAGAFISARQAAGTAELYSCLGSGASYLLLARHLRHWHIGPGAEGVGKGL